MYKYLYRAHEDYLIENSSVCLSGWDKVFQYKEVTEDVELIIFRGVTILKIRASGLFVFLFLICFGVGASQNTDNLHFVLSLNAEKLHWT